MQNDYICYWGSWIYWVSRFYFFSAEMMCPRNGAVCHKSAPQVIKHDNATRELGVKTFFVSTISNATELGLRSMGTYSTVGSPWIITVYRLPEAMV